MGWARLGIASLVAVAACTSEPTEPMEVLRASDIWTAVDDDLPLLASEEDSTRRQREWGCATIREVHELEGPDERVLTVLEDVATDEGWGVVYRTPILESLRRQEDLDGPAAQMVVEQQMGDLTLHVAFTVSDFPDFDGRWTLRIVGDCRDLTPDVLEPPRG